MKDGKGLDCKVDPAQGFVQAPVGGAAGQQEPALSLRGQQKSSQQEPNFKQNQPNFAILIRSTKLSSIMDTDLFPWQCPSQREEDNRLKLPLANKNRDQLKSMSIQKLSASLPDISG